MVKGLDQQRLAVQSGIWPLYRYNPGLLKDGKNPLTIDSKDPTVKVEEYAYNETRYRMLLQSDEARAEMLMKEAVSDVKKRWELYRQMAAIEYAASNPEDNQK
jgi:pyruvate-ferredoxin/flavodoxin oxidoreductase